MFGHARGETTFAICFVWEFVINNFTSFVGKSMGDKLGHRLILQNN